MKITRIETIPVRVPIDPVRAIKGGRGAHTVSPFLLVKVHTDEGLVGLGEVSCTPIWSGEDQVTAAHLIAEYLAPLLVGQDPTHVERLTKVIATDQWIIRSPGVKRSIRRPVSGPLILKGPPMKYSAAQAAIAARNSQPPMCSSGPLRKRRHASPAVTGCSCPRYCARGWISTPASRYGRLE